jgi:outer membrane protein assembly factor BamA
MQFPAEHSKTATAGVVAFRFDRDWERHRVDGQVQIRAATRKLDSDFVYTRHFGEARYRYREGRNTLSASVLLGRITGTAPLFDRFSLGNSSTLRGWNKFDIAPVGGDRVAHASFGHHYRLFRVFYDTGAVWNNGQAIRVRHSVGFGASKDDWFIMLGFPVRSAGVRPMLVAQFRF